LLIVTGSNALISLVLKLRRSQACIRSVPCRKD
jgi:hypothetical protein